MAVELFEFIPEHRRGEALKAFPHCPRIATLLVRTTKVYLHVQDDDERIGNAPGRNGTARPSRRGKLG
jgi:hypothetical protein